MAQATHPPTPTPELLPTAAFPSPTPLYRATPTSEPKSLYEGPLFDTHLHLGFRVRKDRFETAEALCGYLEGKKVGWAIAFYQTPPTEDLNRIPSNQVIRNARNCAVFLIHPLNPSRDKELFSSFVEGLYSEHELRSLLEPQGLFQGVGELSMNLGRLRGLTYGNHAMNIVFEVVNEMGGIVMIHPPDGRHTASPPDLHSLETSIRRYPDITFLIHTSFDWASYVKEHVFPLMDMYPNVYFTLDVAKFLQGPGHSGLMFRNQDSEQFLSDIESIGFDSMLEQAVERALPLFERYPDRIMWGTDLGYSWHYEEAVQGVVFEMSRRFIGKLPDRFQKPYAYDNALRVFAPYLGPDPSTPEQTTIPATSTPTPTHTPTPVPTPKFVRPTGYDIFAPGGMGRNCDSNPNPRFTAHITDLSKISYLTRAGTVQGGDLKPHGYLHNLRSNPEVPVYAPVDSYLIDFAYYEGYTGVGHYTFKFQASCEVAYYFDHLRAVVDTIGNFTPDVPAGDSRGVVVSPPLFFQAGELIGYTGGNLVFVNWDFGVLNTRTWNPLPSEKPYDYSGNVEKYRFAVCPYEYFDDAMRAQYTELLGDTGCGP